MVVRAYFVKRRAVPGLLVTCFLFFFSGIAGAWTPGINQALKNVKVDGAVLAIGNPRCHSECRKGWAVLLTNNDIVNLMRLEDDIPKAVYQSIQGQYATITQKIAHAVAKNHGLDMSVQISTNKTYSPGTDTDLVLTGNPTKKTPENIKKIQNEFNEKFGKAIGELDPNSPARKEVFTKKNDVDFMVDPKGVNKETFKAIAEVNNDAYKDPQAAEFERKYRANEIPTMAETLAYQDEMKEFVTKKKAEIGKLNEALNSPDLSDFRKKKLKAEHKLKMMQQSKYLLRSHDAVDVAKKITNPEYDPANDVNRKRKREELVAAAARDPGDNDIHKTKKVSESADQIIDGNGRVQAARAKELCRSSPSRCTREVTDRLYQRSISDASNVIDNKVSPKVARAARQLLAHRGKKLLNSPVAKGVGKSFHIYGKLLDAKDLWDTLAAETDKALDEEAPGGSELATWATVTLNTLIEFSGVPVLAQAAGAATAKAERRVAKLTQDPGLSAEKVDELKAQFIFEELSNTISTMAVEILPALLNFPSKTGTWLGGLTTTEQAEANENFTEMTQKLEWYRPRQAKIEEFLDIQSHLVSHGPDEVLENRKDVLSNFFTVMNDRACERGSDECAQTTRWLEKINEANEDLVKRQEVPSKQENETAEQRKAASGAGGADQNQSWDSATEPEQAVASGTGGTGQSGLVKESQQAAAWQVVADKAREVSETIAKLKQEQESTTDQPNQVITGGGSDPNTVQTTSTNVEDTWRNSCVKLKKKMEFHQSVLGRQKQNFFNEEQEWIKQAFEAHRVERSKVEKAKISLKSYTQKTLVSFEHSQKRIDGMTEGTVKNNAMKEFNAQLRSARSEHKKRQAKVKNQVTSYNNEWAIPWDKFKKAHKSTRGQSCGEVVVFNKSSWAAGVVAYPKTSQTQACRQIEAMVSKERQVAGEARSLGCLDQNSRWHSALIDTDDAFTDDSGSGRTESCGGFVPERSTTVERKVGNTYITVIRCNKTGVEHAIQFTYKVTNTAGHLGGVSSWGIGTDGIGNARKALCGCK